MSRDAAAPAIAALLKGRVTPFLFGPIGKERFAQGAANTLAAGTVTIQTAAAIGSATITLATPLLTQTVFKALDYLQVGNYLYVVLEDAVSNGAGVVTVKLFNRLRAATSVADVVTFSSPQGLFRVATNTTQWDVDTATTYGLGFDLVESF